MHIVAEVQDIFGSKEYHKEKLEILLVLKFYYMENVTVTIFRMKTKIFERAMTPFVHFCLG
jgi:hypothetical protein